MQARKDISAFLGIMASVAAIAAAMTSCVKETFEMTMPEEGRKVTVTLPLASPGVMETVVTKANTYSNMASIILFIYNADGTVCEKILETENGDITLEGGSEYSDDANSGRLYTARFTATSGVKRICAIGNYEDVTNWEYYDREAHRWGNFSEYIDRIKTQAREGMSAAELGKRVFFLNRVFPENGNTPTFDGWRMISTGAGNISIDTDGNVTDPATGSEGILHMERCVADIQFRITAKAADNPETGDVDESIHNITFSPTSYNIYNIPSGLRLAPGRSYDDNPNEGERPDESFPEFYFDGSEKKYFTEVKDEATSTTYTSLQFFMPENIQKTLTTGVNKDGEPYDFTAADDSGYRLRERWNGTDANEEKIWKFAPENGTYVVITGEYSESDENNNHLYSGTTSYTVHLGDFGPGNWGDFSIRRNHRYIYTVTVSGVNNIKVEATTDNETQPGAEGNIISTQDNVTRNYSLDAHFEQVFLEYNLTEIAAAANTLSKTQGISITEAIAKQMMLSIESPFHSIADLTPYSTYMDYMDRVDGDADALAAAKANDLNGKVDYKWVEFWPQTVSGTDLAVYPGLPAWKNGSNSTNDSQYLLDVYDVCVKMGKAVHRLINGENLTEGARREDGISIFRSDNGSYYARFTGFVDEYYYTDNPLDGSAISWNSFVNRPQRRMIISMDAKTSADGNSTYSTGHTNISQRSIQTFYNAGTATPLNGIGLETFNESRPCPYGSPEGPGNNASASDGRSNTIGLITKGTWVEGYEDDNGTPWWPFDDKWIEAHWEDLYLPDWDYFINDANNGYKESMTGAEGERFRTESTYKRGIYAYYACLSRNRDVNGDGKIDESEVRWYLPAINEYLRLGIGSIAMSNECALMPIEDKTTMTKSGYPQNYLDKGVLYRSSTSGKEVYWAAEKGASGSNTQELNGQQYSTVEIPIRCIRSLPGRVEDLNALADPICDFYSLDDGTRLIDFRDKVVNDLYRDTPTWSAFIEHDEDDLQNRFYDGLVVASRDNGTHRLSDILNIDNNKENPCDDYYEGNNPNDAVNGRGRWRVPNLAEFTVMTTDPSRFFGSDYNDRTYFCSTRFSNSNTRLAFRFSGGQINCLGGGTESLDVNQNTYGYIRCVRDATSSDFNRIP